MRASLVGKGRKVRSLPGGVSKKVRLRYLNEKGVVLARRRNIQGLRKEMNRASKQMKKLENIILEKERKFHSGQAVPGELDAALDAKLLVVHKYYDLGVKLEKLRESIKH